MEDAKYDYDERVKQVLRTLHELLCEGVLDSNVIGFTGDGRLEVTFTAGTIKYVPEKKPR